MIEAKPVKRVLMTTDTLGGVWNYSLEVAGALEPHGVQVVLCALGGLPSPGQSREAAGISNLQLLPSAFKLEWMDDPWADLEISAEWLLEIEQDLKPDIVHLNSYGHGALPWLSPVVLVGHSCVVSWWEAVYGSRPAAQWNRYRLEVECSLRAADVVVSPSASMLRALRNSYKFFSRGRVVPNGRSAARFRPVEKENFIFSVGRLWDPAKNVAALAQIAPSLPWPVYVAGALRDPDGRAACVDGCISLGALSQDELPGWYGRAAIYVLPARYEPFGLSILEAALSGCALVLGEIPSLLENWRDCAVFVPPADPEALRSAVNALIEDPGLRAELSRRSLARAADFAPERMARGYLDVYREALQIHEARTSMPCAS